MPYIPEIHIGDTTYKIKDQESWDHQIEASSTQPTHPANKIWIDDSDISEYEIPMMDDLRDALEFNPTNLWKYGDIDVPQNDGYINMSTLGISCILPAGQYTFSACSYSQNTTDSVVRFLFKVGSNNVYVDLNANAGRTKRTVTFNGEASLIRVQVANTVSAGAGCSGYLKNIQIVAGPSDPPYRPYIGSRDKVLRTANITPSGDVTGSTDAINIYNAYTSSNGYIHMAPGVYYVRVLGLSTGSTRPIMLEGSGKNTVITVLDTDTYNYGIRISNNCVIKDLTIRHINYESYTPADIYTAQNIKHGIRIAASTGASNCHAVIDNVSIEGFSGAGILVDSTGQGTSDGSHIQNCFVDNCGAGIWLNTHAEYCRITGCNFAYNYYGAINDGGNNSFVNCGFNRNIYGFFMDNTSGNLANNSHSQVVGCMFNHIDYDSETLGKGWGIYIVGATSGMQFVGGNMFYGGIYLKNSKGVAINGFNFGKQIENGIDVGCKIQFDHTDTFTYGFLMTNCYCAKAPRFVFPENDNKFKPVVSNCFTREGTVISL